MDLRSSSFADGDRIPDEFAFGLPDPESHVAFGPNRNPHLAWSGVPAGTLSFAVLCHDRDVPTRPDDVNQEGREVPADLPRADFFHWVLADVPSEVTQIAAGTLAQGVVPHGKGQQRALGVEGLNDYTGWFAGDPDMEGEYFGYDGPCPPWNDSILHHYVFTVYAVDVPSLGLSGSFTGADARAALAGHVLAEASLVGTYALNPRLLGP